MKVKKLSESIAKKNTTVNLEEDMQLAVQDYRKYANIDENFEITDENLDEWALNEAANKYYIPPMDLRHTLMNEAVTIDQAARQLEADKVATDSQNQVEKVLDRALKVAKRKQANGDTSDFPNILFISDAGFGKTDMVRQWAASRGINLVEKDLKTMDPTDLGGIKARDASDPDYATRIGSNELIKSFEKPNSVLFLDEYNRAKPEIRGSILTLVQNHIVWDKRADGEARRLPNFLFTIAAINPSNGVYKTKDMDPAERTRFRKVELQPNAGEHLRYLEGFYTDRIKAAKSRKNDEEAQEHEGRLALAKKILSDSRFKYDSPKDVEDNYDDQSYIPLNYRSFKLVLDNSDGTKDDFLDIWNDFCNYKKKPVIETILGDYVDVKDKANDALAGGTESSVFNREKTPREKLREIGLDV